MKIGTKLQLRYSGPYILKKKIIDVVYEALMHGKNVKVHAINMKMYNVVVC